MVPLHTTVRSGETSGRWNRLKPGDTGAPLELGGIDALTVSFHGASDRLNPVARLEGSPDGQTWRDVRATDGEVVSSAAGHPQHAVIAGLAFVRPYVDPDASAETALSCEVTARQSPAGKRPVAPAEPAPVSSAAARVLLDRA